MSLRRSWCAFICVAAATGACDNDHGGGGIPSGGGGSTPPVFRDIDRESPEGIWRGTFTSAITSQDLDVSGVITESGQARFITGDGSQLFGSASGSGSTVSSTLTGVTALGFAWLNGSTFSTFSLSGAVSERSSFSGSYSGGGDNGTFSLTYDPIYERASSLADVAGMWVTLDDFLNPAATFTVDAAGAIIGNDVDGCVYSGSVSILDPNFNAYDVTVSVANCIGARVFLNGSFDGLGVLSDEVLGSGENDQLTVAVNGTNVVITLELSRI